MHCRSNALAPFVLSVVYNSLLHKYYILGIQTCVNVYIFVITSAEGLKNIFNPARSQAQVWASKCYKISECSSS